MRLIPFVVALLLLAPFCFSADYSSSYVFGGWLKVTRTIYVSETPGCASGAATGACSSTGAIQPSLDGSGAGGSTYVTLLAENIGPTNRQNVELSEDLSYVPASAKLHFSTVPSIFEGSIAVWKVQSMEKGGELNISYSFPASLSAGQIGRIVATAAKSSHPEISIAVPASSVAGQKIPISVRTADGAPVANAAVIISYPDGTSRSARTDSSGAASVVAGQAGFYTYSADGYSLSRLVSTDVQSSPAIPPNAASAVGQADSLASFVYSLLPALAAIFAAAVLVLLAYNFLISKKEGEPYYLPLDSAKQGQSPYPPPTPASQQKAQQAASQPTISPQPSARQASSAQQSQPPSSQPTASGYTQTFTFGPGQQKPGEKDASAEITRLLVESRKKQLQAREVAEKEPQHNHLSYSEETIDSEQQTASLASEASVSGELTQHEEEIANTMRELEDIRRKLQERRSAMQKYMEHAGAASQEHGKEGEPEERRPSPRKPSPKIAKKSSPKTGTKKRR